MHLRKRRNELHVISNFGQKPLALLLLYYNQRNMSLVKFADYLTNFALLLGSIAYNLRLCTDFMCKILVFSGYSSKKFQNYDTLEQR